MYTGDYVHYGFSLDKTEWSYGETSAGVSEIRKLLKSIS
jgi:hypothetical protein